MKTIVVALLALFLVSPAFSQQADPAFLQKAISALQGQRNAALDQAAAAEAKGAVTADELAKAQSKIKELEHPKPAEPAK